MGKASRASSQFARNRRLLSMIISTQSDWLAPDRVLRHRPNRDGAPINIAEAIALLAADREFRRFLTETIAAAPFEALFWETPPVTAQTAGQRFEFVLVDAPALARARPQPDPFAEKFAPGAETATFRSLAGDALLIAPCPLAPPETYPHLARFLRDGPAEQVDALWRTVGAGMRDELCDAPRWLSTSGMGVYWLHVRIDQRPKYYTHAPYRSAR